MTGSAPHETRTGHQSSGTAPRSPTSAGIVGASGYSGAVLAEILLRHPSVRLTHMSSDRLRGEPVRRHLPRLRTDLTFCPTHGVTGVHVAFVCTPHGEAAAAVKALLDGGARVVDLSAAFRLDAAAYAEWYGEHPCPDLTPAVYGLTELHRAQIAGARLVANPGCYPTAALLALEPLRELGLSDVVVDAKSGVSGAGRTPSERTHFCAVDSDLVAYGVGTHRHYPEISRGLGVVDGRPTLTFVPHLVPLQRGISETIYVKTVRLPPAEELRCLFDVRYHDETFVEVCDAPPQLKDVVGTNYCRIFPAVDARAGRVIVISVIDNLVKGAAGQAVQNMNVMLGLPEQEGLV